MNNDDNWGIEDESTDSQPTGVEDSNESQGMRPLEVTEQIAKFQEFIEHQYHAELLEKIRTGENFLTASFVELSKFCPDLADLLLDQPEEVIKAGEIAIADFGLPPDMKKFHLRFKDLPKSQEIKIRNIRSRHIDKLIFVDGIVRQKSDVRPQVTSARFECPSCGNIIAVLQLEIKFREPNRCGCGRKGKFKLLSKDLVDAQKLVLEESPEKLEGGEQPKRMDIFLKDDLVSPLSDKKTNPGTRILVVGRVTEVPIPSRDGGNLVRYDLMIEANHLEAVEEDFGDLLITEEEKQEIIALSNDPKVISKLIEGMAPSIYGHDRVKEAIVYQLLGGVKKTRSDGAVTRGDMHVLLVGDPGAGKSQLLKRAQIVAPKARYISGKGASGAGLTAAVVKDEFLKGWSLEAGALVLANRGFCMIDEMDKMSTEDRSAMHEALEQQTVTISKANIQATLRCETTVLAAANPKWGRFDPYEIIAKQIDLPPPLISRFDLIFPIKDIPSKDGDERIASFILGLHKTGDVKKVEVTTELLRKFISYARRSCSPVLTDGALEEIKNYYVQMRNAVGEEGVSKSIPITARQLEALVRLAEASAKTRLSDKVTKRDAKKSIDLLHFCMSQVGIDPETGKLDIDVLATGVSSSARGNIVLIKEIISELEGKVGKTIPIDDVAKEAKDRGVDADKVDGIIEQLKRVGELFEPRRGFISRI